MSTTHARVLEVSSLVVGYAGRGILPPASFALAREEMWALVGRNGGGKTTLLRTLLGLLPKVGGSFAWAPGAKVGYVPQRSELDLSAPMRVCDVVAQGLEHNWSFLVPGLVRRERGRIEKVLAEVGMGHLFAQPFSQLSDGQRQRVLVARALVNDPDVLILDEPTNGMDVASERAAFDLFARLKSARHLAIIVVSHHMTMLGSRASHVVWVDKDEGHFKAGDVDLIRQDPSFIAHYGTVFGADAPAVARALMEERRQEGAA
jgi:zinc transport system ATP-binding protein